MSARAILARAEAAGMRLETAGDRVRITALAPPPAALLHDLAGAKADILDLLAERQAIQAESALPYAGTPERQRLERKHASEVAGLLTAADRARWGF